jgi:hypothetical protein
MDKAGAAQLRILVKGSRSSAMDKVVAALREAKGGGGAAAGGAQGGSTHAA